MTTGWLIFYHNTEHPRETTYRRNNHGNIRKIDLIYTACNIHALANGLLRRLNEMSDCDNPTKEKDDLVNAYVTQLAYLTEKARYNNK